MDSLDDSDWMITGCVDKWEIVGSFVCIVVGDMKHGWLFGWWVDLLVFWCDG